MKLEIEVPDGFVTGKLVFIEERNTGIWLDAVNVSTGRVIQVEGPDTEGKRGKRRRNEGYRYRKIFEIWIYCAAF